MAAPPQRLSPERLAALPSSVGIPRYDRSAVHVGIVHLGIGAFHRAHQAVYTDDVLAAGHVGWGICGVSLRSPATREALNPQSDLYTVVDRDADGDRLRIIGAIREIMVGPEDPRMVAARMAAPSVRIVSLTVTEKGYCHDPATGCLNEDDPGIVEDLTHPDRPMTAIGLICAALDRRRHQGLPAFTVLSCDNLPANGDTVAGLVHRFAELRDPALARWIADHVTFPDTMVDRIVPATTDGDRAAVADQLGVVAAWPVVAEPFSQWVIEDRFVDGRPAWETAGAELVADVTPYETMKLRLLNGSHSALAYLGYLAGYEAIADTMADPAFASLARRLMDDEVTPTLDVPQNVDLKAYKAALIDRFSNPALQHRTWQIAMDGSQKLPQRLLNTVRDLHQSDASFGVLALAVAAWMAYVTGIDERGRPIDVRDPLATKLRQLADAAGRDPVQLSAALLSVGEVFGDDLPAVPAFRSAVSERLAALLRDGARTTVHEAFGG